MTLTFEQRLMAAVWMVGNCDTEEDRGRWWKDHGGLWNEVAKRGDEAQAWADAVAAEADAKE